MFQVFGGSMFDGGNITLNQSDIDLINKYTSTELPAGLKTLEYSQENIQTSKDIAKSFKNVKKFVVLGTGGSSLGGQALCALKKYSQTINNAPELDFWENIDPIEMHVLLKNTPFQDTVFIAISKSGQTPETICQTSIVIDWLLENGLSKQEIKEKLLILTEPKDSSLTQIAIDYDIKTLAHPFDVGGRFSVFSIVGTLPAVLTGLDVQAFHRGAFDVINELKSNKKSELALSILAIAKRVTSNNPYKINSHVLMHYCDALGLFGKWFSQLWAESLGKDGLGSTPLIAKGTVDQHSQLQLYLDGENDKIFTVIGMNKNIYDNVNRSINHIPHSALASYLNGHCLGDIFNAERDATTMSLIQAKRQVLTIELAELNERALGQLMAYFILEVVITADIMKVNAFDQPAVENSKRIFKEILTRK